MMQGALRMKNSLKEFLEYCDSEEELNYYIRINADWNETSFVEFEKLARNVLTDYADEVFYPKVFVYQFMYTVQSTLDIITNPEYQHAWPKDVYGERIKRLKKLRLDFIMAAGNAPKVD